MKWSRRGFLKWLGQDVQERLPKAVWIQQARDVAQASTDCWHDVGAYAQWTPGVSRVVAGEGTPSLTVSSDPDGIQAVRDDGVFLALRLTSRGRVEVDTSQIWPPLRVLSHATGEPTSNEREL